MNKLVIGAAVGVAMGLGGVALTKTRGDKV